MGKPAPTAIKTLNVVLATFAVALPTIVIVYKLTMAG
jgi:hypothetical protein